MNESNILYRSLYKYYENKSKQEYIYNIINSKDLSLRIIDWFVTNYSKKMNTVYLNNNNQFNVYNSYKSKLKSFSKKNFDPFCRRDRISLEYDDFNIQTTIGQLNFFKWAYDNNIINYIKDNYKNIEDDMNNIYNQSKKTKNKKRKELSLSASRGLIVNKYKIVINFD